MARRNTAASIGQFFADALLGSLLFITIIAVSGVCIGNGARAESSVRASEQIVIEAAAHSGMLQPSIVNEWAARGAALELQKPRQASLLQPSHSTMMWMLGIVFSALVALNIGFVRHLRRAYARSR